MYTRSNYPTQSEYILYSYQIGYTRPQTTCFLDKKKIFYCQQRLAVTGLLTRPVTGPLTRPPGDMIRVGQLLVCSMLSHGRDDSISSSHLFTIVIEVRHKSNKDLYLRLSILQKYTPQETMETIQYSRWGWIWGGSPVDPFPQRIHT